MPNGAWATLKRHFSARQCTDIALLAAYFTAAGSLILAMQLELEPPEMLAKELAWQAIPRDASGQVMAAPNQGV